MDRHTFVAEFSDRHRFALQQHDRATIARSKRDDATAQLDAARSVGRVTRFQEEQYSDACAALRLAENGEDAAILELGEFVWDAIEGAGDLYPVPAPVFPAHSPEPLVSTSADQNEIPRVGEREPSTGTKNV